MPFVCTGMLIRMSNNCATAVTETDSPSLWYVRSHICFTMSSSVLGMIYDSLSLGNIFLLLLLLFLLHYLMVLYEFRNMPPGPRFTTLPVLGNIFSLDLDAETVPETFRRSV